MLVVFIHCCFTAETARQYNISFNEPGYITIFKILICETFGQTAVPLFYFFAGYLHFTKNYNYRTILKKKIKGLLTPYIIWILIAALCYYLTQSIPQLNKLLNSDSRNIVRNWNLLDWLTIFWNHSNTGYPLMGHFYFIKNLMIIFLFAPLIRFALNKIPLLLVSLIVFFYWSGIPFIVPVGFGVAMFYFIVGAFFAIYEIEFFKIFDNILWKEIIALVILITTLKFYKFRMYNFDTIISCIIVLRFSILLITNLKLYKILKYLCGYSFFLYSVHSPFLVGFFNKLFFRYIPLTGIYCLVEFLLASILSILIGTILGIILKRILPPLFYVLNGGR